MQIMNEKKKESKFQKRKQKILKKKIKWENLNMREIRREQKSNMERKKR